MPNIVFEHTLTVWVAQYLAVFCLISIAAWAGGTYMWAKKWQAPVADAGKYLAFIGGLTLAMLIFPPAKDVAAWNPFTWFCFMMLLVMECLWMAFLVDSTYRVVRDAPKRAASSMTDSRNGRNRTNYSRG